MSKRKYTLYDPATNQYPASTMWGMVSLGTITGLVGGYLIGAML